MSTKKWQANTPTKNNYRNSSNKDTKFKEETHTGGSEFHSLIVRGKDKNFKYISTRKIRC